MENFLRSRIFMLIEFYGFITLRHFQFTCVIKIKINVALFRWHGMKNYDLG